MEADSKVARCVRVLEAVRERGELATRDVMELLGVDRQTATRDLRSLREAGVPLAPVDHGARRRYRMDPAARRGWPRPSAGDELALHVGRQVLRFIEGCADGNWLSHLRDSLASAASNGKRAPVERVVYVGAPPRVFGPEDAVVREVLQALLTDHELSLVSGAGRFERLQPLVLALHCDALLLVAREPEGSLRGIPLADVGHARCLEATFRFPPRFDVRAELARAFPQVFSGVGIA